MYSSFISFFICQNLVKIFHVSLVKKPSVWGSYSADSSAEYSAVFGRIFGIGRYQFYLYRSFTILMYGKLQGNDTVANIFGTFEEIKCMF